MRPLRALAAAVILLASAVLWDGSAGAAAKRFDHYSGPIFLGQNEYLWLGVLNASSVDREVTITVRKDNGAAVTPFTGGGVQTIQPNRHKTSTYACSSPICGFSVQIRSNTSAVHASASIWDGTSDFQMVAPAGGWRVVKRT